MPLYCDYFTICFENFQCSSAVGKDGDTAPRTGFMYHFKTAELLVKKWDIDAEDLSTTGKLLLYC